MERQRRSVTGIRDGVGDGRFVGGTDRKWEEGEVVHLRRETGAAVPAGRKFKRRKPRFPLQTPTREEEGSGMVGERRNA